MNNHFTIKTAPVITNERAVRNAIVSFVTSHTDLHEDKIGDIGVCVSEAFNNCAKHAFGPNPGRNASVTITCRITEKKVTLIVYDNGKGIENINQAKQPMFTTGGKDHSGMGFTIMESFSDNFCLSSVPGKCTRTTMTFRVPSKK